MQHRLQQFGHRAWVVLWPSSCVAAITWAGFALFGFNSATAALSYVLLVLALATRAGLFPSIVASLGSTLCYNLFFLPPVGTLTIRDPQNWVALVVFLVTAVTTSQLSAGVQRRANEATARREEMERLYELSRSLMLWDESRRVAGQIAQQIAHVFQVPEVAFYELATGSVFRGGSAPSTLSEELLRAAAETSEFGDEPLIVPVQLGGHVLGSLGLRGVTLSPTAAQAIAQLAGIAIERVRAYEATARAEAARQNQQLKSTLLDAVAHEFKTPLTSVKAAVTTLLSRQPHQAAEAELLTIINEEADRLTKLVTEAIDVARIGAGQLRLERQPYAVDTLVDNALAQLQPFWEGREVKVQVPARLPRVNVDRERTELVLRQLLDNALKYAPVSSPIRISAEDQGRAVVLSVANDGPGLASQEQLAIFEKFYRGRDVRDRVPGTGLGLHIAREIITLQGGRIWVESQPGQGVQFRFTLPVAASIPAPQQVA